MNPPLIPYLQPGRFIDSDNPKVATFAAEHAKGGDERERAVSLYYAVRDGVRYNPFQNFMADDAYRASACLERHVGWCVSKAALLAASARAAGIPARVGLAGGKNPLTTPQAPAKKGTAPLLFH